MRVWPAREYTRIALELDEGLRHSELLAMRDDIARIAGQLDELLRRVDGDGGARPAQGLRPDG